jgi:hydroxymethylpyrimidine pyrophosphatase-like HAD family hydrolase
MRYVALAAGFDGVLARDDHCDERCIDALRALAATGRKLILVTGRELRELLEMFPEARIFDYVVAENGAVMYRSATRQSEILAQAPPEMLLQELRRRNVTPLTVGSSIVRTAPENEREVVEVLRKLQLEMQLVTNHGWLMLLPTGVSKASGVLSALKELGVSRHNLVAIGDAENDLPLFGFAEQAFAVQNADDKLKELADRVTEGEYCDGFLEVAHELVATDLAKNVPRHKLAVGVREDAQPVELIPCRDSLLVCGPDRSGKTALCNRLIEQLLDRSYQCCVIGADMSGLYRAPSGVSLFGDAHDVPRLTDIMSALEVPSASVAINLAALAVDTRPLFTEALLLQLQALHDRVGRPHAVVIHRADTFLAGSSVLAASARLSEVTMIYSSAEPERLPPSVTASISMAVVLGSTSFVPSELMRAAGYEPKDVSLQPGEALLWAREPARTAPAPERSGSDQATTGGGAPCRMSVFLASSSGVREPVSSSDAATVSGY